MKKILKNWFKPKSKQAMEQAKKIALITGSSYFDAQWYLKHNHDVAISGIDPVVHYLNHGALEHRSPGTLFDTEYYLSQLSFSERENCSNPLLHFLKYGQAKGIKPTINSGLSDGEIIKVDLNTQADKFSFGRADANIAVIIPVYNAAEALADCLASLVKYTVVPCRFIVIDDASSDSAVLRLLDEYRELPSFECYLNSSNLGFTKTVNKGVALSGSDDVVFLNSDTQVTSGWLGRLRYAAYRQADIGTVTPFSNNAGAFSAPLAGFNEVPSNFDIANYGRAVAQSSKRIYPEVPTGNGFCLYIRRACLDDVGALDEEAFPRGYGEENDFCMRAGLKGWRHVIDDATYIHHERSASFGEQKTELMSSGRKVIDARYPLYSYQVRDAFSGPSLLEAKANVATLANYSADQVAKIKPRVLYVLSTLTGGTPQTNQDLMFALQDNLECFVLYCDGEVLTFKRFDGDSYEDIARYILSSPIAAIEHRSAEYDQVVKLWLAKWAIELVHIRHIAWHSLGLVDVVKSLGLPCVFSFHDFYTVCPTVKLLDNQQQFCGGQCSKGNGQCSIELWPQDSFTQLKHAQIQPWKKMFASSLAKCDAFVTTTEQAKQLIYQHYPVLSFKPFKVILHGRNFTEFKQLATKPKAGETIRLLVQGNISEAKGGKILQELANLVDSLVLEINVLGNVAPELNLPGSVICHGAYQREDFADKVAEIKPHIGAVLSIWPETWCHTLTELWSCGVPVIGFDIGAVGERISQTGAGWVLGDMQTESVSRLLQELIDENHWEQVMSNVDAWQKGEGKDQNVQSMGQNYLRLYNSLIKLN